MEVLSFQNAVAIPQRTWGVIKPDNDPNQVNLLVPYKLQTCFALGLHDSEQRLAYLIHFDNPPEEDDPTILRSIFTLKVLGARRLNLQSVNFEGALENAKSKFNQLDIEMAIALIERIRFLESFKGELVQAGFVSPEQEFESVGDCDAAAMSVEKGLIPISFRDIHQTPSMVKRFGDRTAELNRAMALEQPLAYKPWYVPFMH